LTIVPDEQMLDDLIDAGVFEACEFRVFVKRDVARATNDAQAAEDSAGFALEGL
jgi:hypothetical protein